MNTKTAVREVLSNVYETFGEQAHLIEYEGREVINVEECNYDAIEIGYGITAPEGFFVEPINHCLLAVWPV